MKAVAICPNDVSAPQSPNMKNVLAALLIFLTVAALPACGQKEEAPHPDTAEVGKQRERADREQKAKEVEQKRREEAEERADFWKTMVWVVVISGVFFTLGGIAIGSSARKKAEKARENE
jgi:predicted small lipoprotein YifL